MGCGSEEQDSVVAWEQDARVSERLCELSMLELRNWVSHLLP